MLGFRPERFINVVERIKGAYPTPHEFITVHGDHVDRTDKADKADHSDHAVQSAYSNIRKPFSILKELEGAVPESIAYSISRRQMEMLLFLVNSDIPLTLRQKILKISSLRMRRRYFDLAWLLIQNSPDNISLAKFLFSSADYIKRRYPQYYSSSVHSSITSYTEDLPSQLFKIMKTRKAALMDFLAAESIIPDSLLAVNIFLIYFNSCSSKDYTENHAHFITLVRNMHLKPQLDEIVIRYLKQVGILEYIRDMNDAIEAEYGHPSYMGAFWGKAGKSLAQKFSRWKMVLNAETYFTGDDNRKHLLFRRFADHLASIWVNEEEGLLIADFNRFHIIDMRLDESALFLMKNTVYQIHYDNYTLLKETYISNEEMLRIKQNEAVNEADAPDASAAEASASETPVLETPVPETPIHETSVLETPAIEIPAIETPVPETPIHETSVLEIPVPETPVRETPAPETLAEATVLAEYTQDTAAITDTAYETDFDADGVDAEADTGTGIDASAYSDSQSDLESDYMTDDGPALQNYAVGKIEADYTEYYGYRPFSDSPVKAWHDAVENAVTARDAFIYGTSGDIYRLDMKEAGILFSIEIMSKELETNRKPN